MNNGDTLRLQFTFLEGLTVVFNATRTMVAYGYGFYFDEWGRGWFFLCMREDDLSIFNEERLYPMPALQFSYDPSGDLQIHLQRREPTEILFVL